MSLALGLEASLEGDDLMNVCLCAETNWVLSFERLTLAVALNRSSFRNISRHCIESLVVVV